MNAIELAKFRHLGVWVISAIIVVGVVGLSLFVATGSGAFVETEQLWKTLLASMGFAIALIYPLLLAVLASRLVDIEHLGKGWLLAASSSVLPGRILRAKLLVAGGVVITATAMASGITALAGFLLGEGWAFPAYNWISYTVASMLVGLLVLATQLALSAVIENQLVGLAMGVAGLCLAVFGHTLPSWFNHLTPWGYFSLITPAGYVGEELKYFEMPLFSVGILGIMGTLMFALVCRYFDQREL